MQESKLSRVANNRVTILTRQPKILEVHQYSKKAASHVTNRRKPITLVDIVLSSTKTKKELFNHA
jgi:hypothetical protein